MPSVHKYTHRSLPSFAPRQAWYSLAHWFFRRATTAGESPAASWPTSAASASRMSPVEMPCKYNHGSAASKDLVRRTYGGTKFERNAAVVSVLERAFGIRTPID